MSQSPAPSSRRDPVAPARPGVGRVRTAAAGGAHPAEARARPRLASSLLVAGSLAAYGLCFLPIHSHFGRTAFSLSAIPTVVGGALLGPWGVLGTTVVLIAFNRHFAAAVHYPPDQTLPSAFLSTSASVGLGLGAAALVRLLAERRAANAKLAAEVEQRRATEAALQQSARLHQALVESLGEGVALFDDAERCVYANRAAASALGLPLEELLGQSLTQWWTSAASEPRALDSPATEAEHRRYEVTLPPPLQKVLLVTETRWRTEAETQARTLRVFHDVTERVALERQQRQLEVEVERNQALQSLAVLAGGVAHDFNNLLSGVVGNAELALLKLPPTTPPAVAAILRELSQFALEAGQLSKQMLAYAGGRTLSLQPTDLNAEIQQVLRLLRAPIEAGARLELALAPSLPLLLADRVQVRQIVTNLVLNALEAMRPTRGLLRVTTSMERCDPARAPTSHADRAAPAADYAVLSVTDTGAGIAPEHRRRIFEPFFSTRGQGRGMGLAACVGIARGHQGRLEVESEVGVGSQFRLLLPVQRGLAPKPSLAPAAEAASIRDRTVLLIDDELAVRTVTSRMLEELGCQVLVHESGRSGLVCFAERHRQIDVILLDLTMPDLSGLETLTELRAIDPSLRVVLTSGFHPSDISALLDEAGVKGFLDKPHQLQTLSSALQRALGPSASGAPPSPRDDDGQAPV